MDPSSSMEMKDLSSGGNGAVDGDAKEAQLMLESGEHHGDQLLAHDTMRAERALQMVGEELRKQQEAAGRILRALFNDVPNFTEMPRVPEGQVLANAQDPHANRTRTVITIDPSAYQNHDEFPPLRSPFVSTSTISTLNSIQFDVDLPSRLTYSNVVEDDEEIGAVGICKFFSNCVILVVSASMLVFAGCWVSM